MNKEQLTEHYKEFLRENSLAPEDAILTADASAVMMGIVSESHDIEIHVYPTRFEIMRVNHNLRSLGPGRLQYCNRTDVVTNNVPRYHVIRNGVAFQTPEGVISTIHRDKFRDTYLGVKNYLRQRITANEMLKILPTELVLGGENSVVLMPHPELRDIWVDGKHVRSWWSSLLPDEQRDLWDAVRIL